MYITLLYGIFIRASAWIQTLVPRKTYLALQTMLYAYILLNVVSFLCQSRAIAATTTATITDQHGLIIANAFEDHGLIIANAFEDHGLIIANAFLKEDHGLIIANAFLKEDYGLIIANAFLKEDYGLIIANAFLKEDHGLILARSYLQDIPVQLQQSINQSIFIHNNFRKFT